MNIIRQLQIAYKLKRTLRYNTTRNFDVHSESVAEHVFSLFFLAQYFLPLEDPNRTLNVELLYQIMLFHDFGEITHGDVPYHVKTKEHEEQERKDAIAIFASFPWPLAQIAHDRWSSYAAQQGPEARFAYALDKVEPLFELLDSINEKTLKRIKFSYQDSNGKKMLATEGFPIMRKFVEVAQRDMLKRGVFWTGE
ncbi:MAG: phosphohydrolase [Parcubacteria group bacterium GW2011_GWA2_56_21]|nr:MAG: phosphohydrolase [Parcubacteria group bacterium GW2011_GWA2_56_21]